MKNAEVKAPETKNGVSKHDSIEISPVETTVTAIAKQENQSSEIIQTVDMSKGMPDMDSFEAAPFDIMADYWSPETPGEKKKLLFDHIGIRQVLDQQTGEILDLECAFFYEQVGEGKDKKIRSISNGSKRLVGAIHSNNIRQGGALEITYLGKKQNKNNGFKSDNWSIKPLVLKLS